jgi:hypothetical protein
MKRILLVVFLATIGCKEVETAKAKDSRSMLQTQGCGVSKTRGRISVNCADGSSAEAESPTLKIKDGNGADFPSNLLYFAMSGPQAPVFINSTSGNALGFDKDGNLTKITIVYFDGPACTGNGFSPVADLIIKNRIFTNNQAWPGNPQAIKITGSAPGVTAVQSNFTAGACNASIMNVANTARVIQATFDVSDPVTIVQPLELVAP